MVAKRVFFSGRVQGVGFRYTTFDISRDYDVVGFVENLRDGRVHLEVNGSDDEVAKFIAAIQAKMAGNISNIDSHPIDNFEAQSFEIRR